MIVKHFQLGTVIFEYLRYCRIKQLLVSKTTGSYEHHANFSLIYVKYPVFYPDKCRRYRNFGYGNYRRYDLDNSE